jgi:hypothetical protein
MIQNVHSQRGLGATHLTAIGTLILHDHVERLNVILEVVPLLKGPGTGGALPALHPILGYDLTDVPLHYLLIICNTDSNNVSSSL